VINDAVAYIRSLAELRGRNADWAEKAVRDAATLTATAALQERVIDAIARDAEDLLSQIDGRTVTTAAGELRLMTKGRSVVELKPDWKAQVMSVISDPNIAVILLMIGFYGILFEFWSPGAVAPGAIGGICLLIGLGGLSVLPVDYAGLGLLALGMAFMAVEVFVPGMGALGIGGLVAFVAGSLLLYDTDAARGIEFGVAWPVVAAAAIVSALFFTLALSLAWRARRRPVVSGRERMIGSAGKVLSWSDSAGTVGVEGEVWAARATTPLFPNDPVRVVGIEGLTLVVAPGPGARR
jgi:membrane-bound serine protease (ClpP class)